MQLKLKDGTAIIGGYAGRDGELKSTSKGDVGEISLNIAVGKDEPAKWVTVSGWGKTGEIIARLEKRDWVAAIGYPKVDSYTGKDGTPKTSNKLTALCVLSDSLLHGLLTAGKPDNAIPGKPAVNDTLESLADEDEALPF